MNLNISDFPDYESAEDIVIDDIGFIENNIFYKKNNPTIKAAIKPTQKINQNFVKKPVNAQILKNVQETKKKIDYDDILSSLNMKVVNGVLQMTGNKNNNNNYYNSPPQKQNNNNNNNKSVQIKQGYNTPNRTSKNHHLPIPIQMKPIQRPMTKQEAIINYIKLQEERKRINEIKSKKLLFTTSNINISKPNANVNPNSKPVLIQPNHLRPPPINTTNKFFRFIGK